MSITQGLEDTIRLLRVRLDNQSGTIDALIEANDELDNRIELDLNVRITNHIERIDAVTSERDRITAERDAQTSSLNKMYDANDELQDIITSLELKLQIIHLNSKVSS